MAKAHWYHPDRPDGGPAQFGCQHSTCTSAATHQWQRTATTAEVDAETRVQGPYGAVVRNMHGPHRVAVFACEVHAPDLDSMTVTHESDCPSPDLGCSCHAAK